MPTHLIPAIACSIAGTADDDIIQGTVTDAGTNAPLAAVRVASDSTHAVFTGAEGKFILDTEKNASGLVLPMSHERVGVGARCRAH